MGDVISLNSVTVSDDEKQQMNSIYNLQKRVDDFVVANNDDFSSAADLLGDICNRLNRLEGLRKKLKAPILEAARGIDDMFRIPSAIGKDCKKILTDKMLAYADKVNTELKAMQRQLEEKALEDLRIAEDTAKSFRENGNDIKSNETLENMDVLPYYVPISKSPKARGVSQRNTWKCRIVDFKALMRSILADKAPLHLISFNQSYANIFARSVRGTLDIDGLEFYEDTTLISRKK